MAMPIQSAPIDRGNRFRANVAGAPYSQNQLPGGFGPIIGIACEACSLLPPPASIICRLFCRGALGQN